MWGRDFSPHPYSVEARIPWLSGRKSVIAAAVFSLSIEAAAHPETAF